jgi:signal transduction histidine kinase
VTPISSLAATVNNLINDLPVDDLRNEESSENLQDISQAIQTIQKRSEGLLHFVEAYRSLTRLPQPKFREFLLRDLFGRLKQLTEEEMKTAGIVLKCDISPKNLNLTADPEQMEQVLINLLKNAIEVLREISEASIIMKGYSDDRGRVVIQVIDNGPGIPADIQEKIFIPFFTTKKDGSGIGLSLSRQIIRLHKGSISVSSDQQTGTAFTIRI